MSLKVAVIGGGNGGFATASQMALAGHEVHLFELPDFSANIAELKRKRPSSRSLGALLTGEARLAGVSCDPADGFSDCEIVLGNDADAGAHPHSAPDRSLRPPRSGHLPHAGDLRIRPFPPGTGTGPGLEAS